MSTGTQAATTIPMPRPKPGRWQFIGKSSLPLDPAAREHERRGRRWLFVSYFLCPCHIPLTMALLGVLFGGTALGAALAGNAFRVGAVLVVAYSVVLWRGFRQIRLANRIEAGGGTISCTPDRCTISPPWSAT